MFKLHAQFRMCGTRPEKFFHLSWSSVGKENLASQIRFLRSFIMRSWPMLQRRKKKNSGTKAQSGEERKEGANIIAWLPKKDSFWVDQRKKSILSWFGWTVKRWVKSTSHAHTTHRYMCLSYMCTGGGRGEPLFVLPCP